MASHKLTYVFSLLFTQVICSAITKPNSASISSRIWDDAPALLWNDSFVIGNGRVGAVIGGVVASDVIHVNEDSLWSGGPLYRVNPDAKTQMPYIQQDIRSGHVADASTLAGYAYAGTPVSTQHYDPLGDLTLTMTDTDDETTYYERWLDVADGTSGVFYTLKGVQYEREFIASEPAGIIAMRLRASKPGALSFHLHLDRGDPSLNRWEDLTQKVGSDTIIMAGASGGFHPVQFATGAKIVSTDGKVSTLGDYVFCKKATEAWVYFQAWTSYRKDHPYAAVLADLDAVQSQSYEEIRAAHVSDYQSYFNRTVLNLGTSTEAQKNKTTRARIKALTKGAFDPEVASLYFQFGRYLLIATSRAGTLPPNLQGIWNSDLDPEWGSKYTININLQMNYWPSLVTNLADLTSPLYDFISRMRDKGSEVAQAMYNSSGAMAHHNTDIWADCAPQDNYFSSTWWPSGLAWLAQHVVQDYLFTGNTALIQEHYSTLRDVLQFYLDFVTEGPNGWLVTNPSISPENAYYLPNSTTMEAITMGPTMDNSLIWELVGYALEVMKILGTEDETFSQQIETLRERVLPIQISYFGGVQEWIYDYKETEIGHRHFSPLFGLYPGSQITSANATAFDAAKKTLTRRLSHGGGDTGWSRAWAISLAARSFLPNEVHHSLVHLLTVLTYPTSLLDTGPPAAFQIDGNFGGPAGIAEALIQSHELVGDTNSSVSAVSSGMHLEPAYWGYGEGEKTTLIRLLPALPTEWASNGGGYVRGLRARGGFEIDIAWNSDGSLKSAHIESLLGNAAWITVGSEPIGMNAAKTNVTEKRISVNGGSYGRFVLLEAGAGVSHSIAT